MRTALTRRADGHHATVATPAGPAVHAKTCSGVEGPTGRRGAREPISSATAGCGGMLIRSSDQRRAQPPGRRWRQGARKVQQCRSGEGPTGTAYTRRPSEKVQGVRIDQVEDRLLGLRRGTRSHSSGSHLLADREVVQPQRRTHGRDLARSHG